MSDRLASLATRTAAGATIEQDDACFLGRVAILVGIAIANPPDASDVERLRDAWKTGSKVTMRIMSQAFSAESGGDVELALDILNRGRNEMRMPFYASLLDQEHSRISLGETPDESE